MRREDTQKKIEIWCPTCKTSTLTSCIYCIIFVRSSGTINSRLLLISLSVNIVLSREKTRVSKQYNLHFYWWVLLQLGITHPRPIFLRVLGRGWWAWGENKNGIGRKRTAKLDETQKKTKITLISLYRITCIIFYNQYLSKTDGSL